ncbi:hypothetical protein D9M69_609880 [compost metagenome]
MTGAPEQGAAGAGERHQRDEAADQQRAPQRQRAGTGWRRLEQHQLGEEARQRRQAGHGDGAVEEGRAEYMGVLQRRTLDQQAGLVATLARHQVGQQE